MNAELYYVAIIGDLRRSRRAANRQSLQRRLLEATGRLNDELWTDNPDRGLTAPVSLTAGDEVQGLFIQYGLALHVIETLSDAARPSEFTFGIGFGALSTDLHENVALIDGPAFHTARDALLQARSDGSWAAASGFGDDGRLITAMLYLLGAIRGRWTERQLEIIEAVKAAETQNEAAERIGVSPSVVSESLKAAAFTQYQRGHDALLSLLDGHA